MAQQATCPILVVKSTGIALEWIGRTISLAAQVKNKKTRCSPLSPLRAPLHSCQIPAKAKSACFLQARTNA
jgi:hypothetical protein